MKRTLLLGPGLNHKRVMGGWDFGSDPDEELIVVDNNLAILEHWRSVGATPYWENLSKASIFALGPVDEIHAYELLNLLPGNERDFFWFWSLMWLVLKPSGRVYATVPHWSSRFIYAYPGQQRVYTPELLAYLDRDAALGSRSDFDSLWPKPYCFKTVTSITSHLVSDPSELVGYHFVLEKTES